VVRPKKENKFLVVTQKQYQQFWHPEVGSQFEICFIGAYWGIQNYKIKKKKKSKLLQINRDDTRKSEICCVSAEIDKHPNFENLKIGFKKLIPNCEIISLLDGKLARWSKVPHVLPKIKSSYLFVKYLPHGPKKIL
jgi:hypothetical protein